MNIRATVGKGRKLLASLFVGAVATVGMSTSAHAVIVSDIIMIVDESGSMGNVQNNLRTNIGTFASILAAGGIDAQFGLVGYGNSQVRPRMLTDLTTAAGFATAATGLQVNGGTEPAFTASAFALNGLDGQSDLFSFRANAVKNIIIFTDEPHNGTSLTYGTIGGVTPTFAAIDALLTANNALYNAVLRNQSTINSIGGLATAHGGQVFDLNGLNTTNVSVVDAFVQAFAAAKLQETIDFCTANPTAPGCVPTEVGEPTSMALIGLGLLGLGFAKRRRKLM